MIICPNLSNPEVAREFEELVQATSEQAAYHIWSLNNGNAIDKAPNGAESKLFLTLLEYYNGDRTKAIQAKAKTYGKSFLNWFGDWTSQTLKKYRYLIYDVPKDRYLSEDELSEVRNKFDSGQDIVVYAASNDVQSLLNGIDFRKNQSLYFDIDENAFYASYTLGYAIDYANQYANQKGQDLNKIGLVKIVINNNSRHVSLQGESEVKIYRGATIKSIEQLDIDKNIRQIEIKSRKSNSISKVVDENGEPLPVWHGGYITDNNSMPNPTYTEETYDEWGEPFPGRELNPGIWFTTDKEYTDNFSRLKYLCFLNIKHPYYGDNLDSSVAANIKELEDYSLLPEDIMAAGGKTDGLIGHDSKKWGGATIEEMKNDPRVTIIPKVSKGIEFAIYYPNQAKSIDNEGPTLYEGTFSRENDNIYYQKQSSVNADQIVEQKESYVNSVIQEELKLNPGATTELIIDLKEKATQSWAERRQQEILGQTQLRLAQAFGLTRNEDGKWSTKRTDEISKLRLEFVRSLGDHAGQIVITKDTNKAFYAISIGLLEGDASTFNHELAHYYIHTFWNSKIVQTALKLVYNPKKRGDINTIEGRKAAEEALIDAITERSVDDMFDVKLSQKSFFLAFWESFNRLLYKLFNVKTKVALNAIFDQITAYFLVNEQLEQSKRNVEIKEIQGLYNQSMIQRMRKEKKVTYKQRKVGTLDIAYDPISNQRSDEKVVQKIVGSTQRKARLYSTRSIGSGESSIYGIADQMALNLEAVRKVRQQAQNISEATQANDAQRELHEKADMFMDFMQRSLEEITRLNRILDNAEANEYRQTAYIVDSAGEKQYSDDSGQIKADDMRAKTLEFNYDELEYIRDNVLGFIEPAVTAIEGLLNEAQQLGYSDEDIQRLQEFLYNTQIVALINHVLAKYNNATKRKINKWIDETVDARKELNDDFKRRLKVNMKNWASDQLIFGDVSMAEIGIGMGSHSKSPIIKAMQDMINDMTDERDELVYQKGLALMDLKRKAEKAVNWKYKLFGMNFQKLLMQLDKRGLPTGNLIAEYNDGLYYQDLTEYRDKLAFGKNGLEKKLKLILGEDFVLLFDRNDIPLIPENDEAERLAKEFMTKLDEWKCDNGSRQYTKKYYRMRNEHLSFKAIRAIATINGNIEDITRAITINGKLRLDLLTESQLDELQQLLFLRLFLGNIYTPDGILKSEGSEERQIAEEISSFRALTKDSIKYTTDWDAFYESRDNAKNRQAFENRYLHYQVNPRIYELLGKTDYSTYQDIVELQEEMQTLRAYRNQLINQYKGPSFGLIYWARLIKNGQILNVEFWKTLLSIDNLISEISAELKNIIELIIAEKNAEYEKLGIKGKDGKPATFSFPAIHGEFNYSDLFESVLIPVDRKVPDWSAKNVETVLARAKNVIRESIRSDETLSAEEKEAKIKELLDLFEYYNVAADRMLPLSIFSIDKPVVALATTEDGETIPMYKQIPTGVFSTIDIENSSSEYVNKKFDSSTGRHDKPGALYKDSRWEQLKEMPKAVMDLYDEVRATMEESWNMIPFLGRYDGRMSQMSARTGQRLGRLWYKHGGLLFFKNFWNWLKWEFSVVEDDLYYDEHEARNRRSDGEINKSIPLRFINRLELPEWITSDVVGSTILFYNMAQNWRIKSKNLAFFTLLQQRTGMMNFKDESGSTEYKPTNQSKVIAGNMDRLLFERRTIAGQTVNNINGTFTPNKFVKYVKNLGKVRAMFHLGLLAMNLSSAVVSFLDPLSSLVIDTITGKYINARDDLYALRILFGNANQLFTGGSIYANNKVKAAMQKLHLDESTARMFEDTDMSQLSRFIADGITMKLFSFGDYTINAISVVATMHNYKCYVFKDGHMEFMPKRLFITTAMQDKGLTVKQAKSLYNNKHTKNMWECCERDKKTGEFRASSDEYGKAITEENWRQVRKQTQSRSSIYTGVVGDTERTLFQTDAILGFFTMMRNFLITGIWDRLKNQRDFLVTTFDEDGLATFGDIYADDKKISSRISVEEAKQTQKYYKGGFSFSTRLIEDGIYTAGLLFFKQVGGYLNLMLKSSIFRGEKALSKYDREKYMKEKDLNSNTIYATERIMLELGLVLGLILLIPLSKKWADDDKDNWIKLMTYLMNLRLAIERVTYYNPSTLMETITTPATAYSDFKRKLKGLDLILDFTPIGEHDLNDKVKLGNFKGESRWKYNLFSMLSSLGLYNWYTNMPEMKVGEYNIGGGGGRTLRGKANFYKKFVDAIVKILPYGQQQPEVKPTKQQKSLYERRQDRLKQRQNRQQLRQKRLDKRRNR